MSLALESGFQLFAADLRTVYWGDAPGWYGTSLRPFSTRPTAPSAGIVPSEFGEPSMLKTEFLLPRFAQQSIEANCQF
jgi:hypothetical protein